MKDLEHQEFQVVLVPDTKYRVIICRTFQEIEKWARNKRLPINGQAYLIENKYNFDK